MERTNGKLIKLKLKDIKPYKRNAKLHPESHIEKIRDSIISFGYKDPIAVDETNTIIEGHGRLRALYQIDSTGEKEIDVLQITDLNESEKRAYRIAHNKLNMMTDFDVKILKEEFYKLEDTENFNDTGFDTKEITEIWDEDKEVIEDKIDIDAYERAKSKTKIQSGDVYLLGDHRLMCGDSTEKDQVNKLMNGQKADMVLTDPPYGMCLDADWSDAKSKLSFLEHTRAKSQGNKYEKVIGDNADFKIGFITHTLDYFNYCKEIFLWGFDYYAEIVPNRINGSVFVWDKRSNEGTDIEKVKQSDKMYGSCFELCWSKNRHKREIVRVKWAGIFGTETEPDKDKSRVHPTQKPVNLSSWFLSKFSKKDNLIVDLFGGSGSTLIACEQLNRKCFMMEIDPVYVEVICQRWEKFTGKKRVKL